MNKKITLPVLCVICALALGAMITALVLGGTEKTNTEFVPPAFEPEAVRGTPTVSDASWTRVYQDGMDFSAHVCGNVILNGGSADVYFTNDAGNKVWLKLRVLDEAGSILGETGILKPDEYVRAVKLDTVPKNGAKIKLKIMAYEPETYYSAGAVSLNTVIGGNS